MLPPPAPMDLMSTLLTPRMQSPTQTSLETAITPSVTQEMSKLVPPMSAVITFSFPSSLRPSQSPAVGAREGPQSML